MQKNQSNYEDLGGNHFDRIHSDGLRRHLVKRLEQLGHKVTLEPIEDAWPTFHRKCQSKHMVDRWNPQQRDFAT